MRRLPAHGAQLQTDSESFLVNGFVAPNGCDVRSSIEKPYCSWDEPPRAEVALINPTRDLAS
jgi:hypothetical protein